MKSIKILALASTLAFGVAYAADTAPATPATPAVPAAAVDAAKAKCGKADCACGCKGVAANCKCDKKAEKKGTCKKNKCKKDKCKKSHTDAAAPATPATPAVPAK